MSIKPEHFEKLREMLISGAITALTFDTQVFDRNGRTFRKGLLAQLAQIKNSKIQLIITELVRDEAEKHMLEMHSARQKRVDDAFALVAQNLSDDLVDEICEELQARATPKQIAFHEVNDFFLATNAELAFYDEISISNLFELYFNNKPPFHKGNDKKYEFPDAVALLSLEAYAENSGILVVSSDKDWIEFCNSSENKRLHCIPDLTTALSLINSIETDVKEIASQRSLQFQKLNDGGGLKAAISDNLIERLKRELLFTARTNYFYNARCSSIKIVSITHGEDKTFGKIRDDLSKTIWALELDAVCHIAVDVDFFNDDESYIGCSSYYHFLPIPTISIVKIAGECIDVEVNFDAKTTLDLGAITPDELTQSVTEDH
ncbi:PIN domain-containing protein [Pseudomonas citronellolis]|nr:PIN domain-containing protein [Pseudomonas citronellolis]